MSLPQSLPAYLHGRCLELVRREHRSGRAGNLGRDQSQIRKFGVGRFHADVRSRDKEPLGVCARRWYVFLFRRGNSHFQRSRVVADLVLALRDLGENGHCGPGLGVQGRHRCEYGFSLRFIC